MLDYSKIAVILLNYNSSVDTIALYQQVKSFYKGISIFVIDNNSKKEGREKLISEIDREILILNSKNSGYAGGNNIGIKKAIEVGAEYVLILNPDISIEKETLPVLLQTIQQNMNIAAVGPRICYSDKKEQIYSDGGVIIKEKGYYTTHINYNKFTSEVEDSLLINEVDYVNGSAMLINVLALEKIGLMREDFFLYFEETEWCLRAKDNGLRLLTNRGAKAYHISSLKGKMYRFYMVRNRILLSKLRGDYYKRTLRIVGKSLFNELKQSFKKKRLSKNTLYGVKGYLFGLMKKID